MNTVHKGLRDLVVKSIPNETDQLNSYNNHAIDYLSERIEAILINKKSLDEAVDFVKEAERFLDEYEGVY